MFPKRNAVEEAPGVKPILTSIAHVFALPPSRAIFCPVTKSLSPLARKMSAPSRLCGCSSRGNPAMARGWAVRTCSGFCCTTESLKVKPGANVLTRMPCSPSSRESARCLLISL
jgi:hypothetical protein